MSNIKKSKKSGFSLLEVMLGLIIVAVGVVVIYNLATRAQLSASVERSQRQMSSLVEIIDGAFSMMPTFGGVSTQAVIDEIRNSNSSVDAITVSGDSLVSGFNQDMSIRPASVENSDDGYDIVFHNLSTNQCTRLIPAVYPGAYDVLLGNDETSVVERESFPEGRLVDGGTLTQSCSTPEFNSGNGSIAFRFFKPRDNTAVAGTGACTCIPVKEEQVLGCPAGSLGSISFERQRTCTEGTPTCRQLNDPAWVEVENTCSPELGAPDDVTITPQDNLCSPYTYETTTHCPPGETGYIELSREFTCTANGESIAGPWNTGANHCTAKTTNPTCNPGEENITENLCPSGNGSYLVVEVSSCPTPFGPAVWTQDPSHPLTVSTLANCDDDVIGGTICSPTIAETDEHYSCPSNMYGEYLRERVRYNLCPSGLSDWMHIKQPIDNCHDCPDSEHQFRWVNGSRACPVGQNGNITYQYEERRTRTASCDGGSAPTWTPLDWDDATWSATGNERNEVNNCEIPPTSCPAGQIEESYPRWSFTLDGFQDSLCNGSMMYPDFWAAFPSWPDMSSHEETFLGTACTSSNQGASTSTSDMCYSNSGDAVRVEASCSMGTRCIPDPDPTPPPACGDWILNDSGTAINWGNTDGEYVNYTDGEGGGCYAGWGPSYGVYGTHTPAEYNACLSSIPDKAPHPNARYELREYSGWGGGMENWRVYVGPDTCDATGCTAPAPTTAPTVRNATPNTQTLTCESIHGGTAADWTGSITQSQSRTENGIITTTWTCPGPTSSTSTNWLGTYNEGSWVTTNDSCQPVTTSSCSLPAGTTRSWTIGGNTCNGPGLTSGITIASGANITWSDTTPPTTGTASFRCTNGSLAATPNTGATCNAAVGCTPSSVPMVVFNSIEADDGTDQFADTWYGNMSNWNHLSSNNIVCNATNEGRMLAVTQIGPFDAIMGVVYLCRNNSFIELWSQEYTYWSNVFVTSQGAAIMGISPHGTRPQNVIPSEWRPFEPQGPGSDWSSIPGLNTSADYAWTAKFVCGGGS